jgi:hypothetical protein
MIQILFHISNELFTPKIEFEESRNGRSTGIFKNI